MGYRIRYKPSQKKQYGIKKCRILLLLILVSLLGIYIWYHAPEQWHLLEQSLFPSDQLNDLLMQLRSGEDVLEALSAFCQGILDEG